MLHPTGPAQGSLGGGRAHLRLVVRGKAHDGIPADHAPRDGGRQVILAKVQSGGFKELREVGTVVDYQQRPSGIRQLRDPFEPGERFAR